MDYDPMAQPAPSSAPAPRVPRTGHPRRPRRLLRWTWPLLAALIFGVIGGVGVAAAIHMPRVDALADYTPSLVTQFYNQQGEVFSTFSRERRVMLKPEQIPPVMQQAVLASEDSNFFQHGGIDALGIGRAALADIRHGKIVEGASTITMQLARTVFLSRERTWRRKVEEAMLAVELEKNYSKQQILTLYLNLVNLGHGNYGVEAASRYYFGKPAMELTLNEAATLAGILPLPSRYSPYRLPDVVRSQRNRVLRRMLDERFITPAEYQKAVDQPLLVTAQQAEEKTFAPYFAEDIRKHLESTYGATQLYEGGLQVRTTLDPQIQRDTEKAVRAHLLRLDHRRGWRGAIAHLDVADLDSQQLPTWGRGKPVPDRWYQGIVLESGATTARVKIGGEVYTLDRKGFGWTRRTQPSQLLKQGDVAWFRLEVPEVKPKDDENEEPGEPRLMLEQEPRMEGAAVVIEHGTGAIRAMVGGWDFERNKFNRITQAKRQVGSAFKPFVYGAALEAGWTPSDTLLDAPTSFRGADGRLSYRPQNYYKNFHGIVTLRRALEQSINVPAVKLFDVVGGKRVVDFARRCGINTPLPTYPSIALGAADLTPLELAAAFATIANRGTHIAPYMIEKVVTADGQVLQQRFPATYTATDSSTAYMLTHMMEGVIDRGTAFELKSLPIDIAGKTGTTDDFSDAWFAGFTPRHTIVVWVGYDVKRPLGYGMSGAVAAVPMWKGIAEAGLKSGWLKKDETFPVPSGIVFRQTEYRSGLLAKAGGDSAGAKGGLQEAFRAGTEPTQEHSSKWSTITSLPWYQQKAFYIPKEGENVGQSTDAGSPTPQPEAGAETPGAAPEGEGGTQPEPAPQDAAPQEQPAEPPPA